jgi:hypothetical protein
MKLYRALKIAADALSLAAILAGFGVIIATGILVQDVERLKGLCAPKADQSSDS